MPREVLREVLPCYAFDLEVVHLTKEWGRAHTLCGKRVWMTVALSRKVKCLECKRLQAE